MPLDLRWDIGVHMYACFLVNIQVTLERIAVAFIRQGLVGNPGISMSKVQSCCPTNPSLRQY